MEWVVGYGVKGARILTLEKIRYNSEEDRDCYAFGFLPTRVIPETKGLSLHGGSRGAAR